ATRWRTTRSAWPWRTTLSATRSPTTPSATHWRTTLSATPWPATPSDALTAGPGDGRGCRATKAPPLYASGKPSRARDGVPASSARPRLESRPVARSRSPFPLLAALAFVSSAATARAQMTALETDDLRLIYLNPTQSYLAPHVARCFENSQGFHRKLFQYKPSEKVTVLLNDFSDFGNAGARAVPRDFVTVDIAPLSFAYETVTANERMNMLMNHELVHVATMDEAGGSERFFRGLFRGKVLPRADHPETILYTYLTNPRMAAPRWYVEGIAVFL